MFLRGLSLLLEGGLVTWPLLLCAVLSLTVIIERSFVIRGAVKQTEVPSRHLTKRLAILDTIITIAPLLGLLGTVTGMIRAFHAATGLGMNTSAVITGGVAQSLIATALGLGIAIVSLVGYNALTGRIKTLSLSGGVAVAPAQKRGQPEFKKARIEIIPMIDTIFFLLVFFMMVSLTMTPFPARRVNLPESATASLKPQNKIIVTLAKGGEYYIDKTQISESRLLPLLAARIQADPSLAIVINCDKEQPISQFTRVFDLVKQANAGSVMIATAPHDVAVAR